MSETTNCPSCQRALRIPEELVGQGVKCPACGTTFTASPAPPRPREEPPPAERRPSPREARPASRDDDFDLPPRRRPSRYEDDYDRPRRRGLAPHRGQLILVLGLVGFLFLPIPLAPMAWWMGSNDLQEMRAGRMDPEGEGLTQVGRILGMISTILNLAVLLLCLVGVVVVGIMAAMH